MRRRGATVGVRESLSAWYWDLSRTYDQPAGDGECAKLARALDAGEPIVVQAYEVDGAGVRGLVRVEPDGQIVPVEWDPATRAYEVLS